MSLDSTLTRRMTMTHEDGQEKRFVSSRLPWLVAGVALAIYLLTLARWVSFNSMAQVARVSGWVAWQPDFSGPLFWLITYPFHWLPEGTIQVALNLFSAACAAATLALLSRSVALLPHDRTEDQRIREKSPFSLLSRPAPWLPPVLAAVVCGLQLSFWENATAASSEIFDVLLFAYIIRCLLEFRLDNRDSWLWRASLVYGMAITNNWAMLGFLPLFLVALVWLKGVSFFNSRFLIRMCLLALVGLCFYLLLPLINSVSGTATFWDALKSNLGTQKFYLSRVLFNKYILFKSDSPLWVLALPSLVPLLFVSISWPASFGDISKIGKALTSFALNVVHGVLLVLCLWVALDPEQFGPRHLLPQLPLLTFYYLGALSIGYFAGYFLLVFGAKPAGRPRPMASYRPMVNVAVVGGVWVLAVVTPILLLARNLPQIQLTNGPQLNQYARSLAGSLPNGAVVLCDDFSRLFALHSALDQARRGKDVMLVETDWLQFPAYHRFLRKYYGNRWASNPPQSRKELFPPMELMLLLRPLAQSNAVFYAHPSFGYYFELFYPQAHGLAYGLSLYPTNSLLPPGLSQTAVEQNEKFWTDAEDSILTPLTRELTVQRAAGRGSLLGKLERKLHLGRETNPSVLRLGMFYSRALDYWGVELQKAGHDHLKQAAHRFEQALALNPDNVAAQANLECNAALQSTGKAPVQISNSIQDQFGKYRGWDDLINANGPFDQPTFCYAQGMSFAYPNNPRLAPQYHQAAEQFYRVTQLAPTDLDSRLRLAEVSVYGQAPDAALQIVADIHQHANTYSLTQTNLPWLLAIETAAHLSKGDIAGAEATVDAATSKDPKNPALLSAASRMFMTFGCYTNALSTIQQQLQLKPDDPNALYGRGLARFQLKAYDQAIGDFNHVMDLETNRTSDLHVYSLLYRAQSFLAKDQLENAQQDYEALQKDLPKAVSLHKEIADIAYRRKDTNSAIQNYEEYLKEAPTNRVADIKMAKARLQELKSGAR